MSNANDDEYNAALYGINGTATRCRCGTLADYMVRATEEVPWAGATGWCLRCRPRRGRRPLHGERFIRAWIHSQQCTVCGTQALQAVTAPSAPPLSVLRRGQSVQDVDQILSRATAFCGTHAPVQTLSRQASAAGHPYADRAGLRAALEDPAAVSYGAVARLMGVKDGGSTTKSLLTNHAAHTIADPSFPPLPTPRSQAFWGTQAWADR